MTRRGKRFNFTESFLSGTTLNNKEINIREESFILQCCKAVSKFDSFQRGIPFLTI